MRELGPAMEWRGESAPDALVAIFVASRAAPTKPYRANNAAKMSEAQTIHRGFDLGRGDRFVRVAAHPIVQVVMEVHSAIAAIVGDVGGITATADQAGRAKRCHIDSTRPSLRCRRSLRVPPLLDRPSPAQTRLAIERESEKTIEFDARRRLFDRLVHGAGMVQHPPAVDNV